MGLVVPRSVRHASNPGPGPAMTIVEEKMPTHTGEFRRPRDEERDLFGITHVGKVRKENQDHFLICTIYPQVVIDVTSLPDTAELELRGQRIATMGLVADGVG